MVKQQIVSTSTHVHIKQTEDGEKWEQFKKKDREFLLFENYAPFYL